MGIVIEENEGSSHIVIKDNMTIYEAAEQKKQLLKALKKVKKNEQMEINLSDVNEMDTAGVQLLLLLKKTAEKGKKIVLLVAHSPASLDVIDRYNLAAMFGDPVIVSSAKNKA